MGYAALPRFEELIHFVENQPFYAREFAKALRQHQELLTDPFGREAARLRSASASSSYSSTVKGSSCITVLRQIGLFDFQPIYPPGVPGWFLIPVGVVCHSHFACTMQLRQAFPKTAFLILLPFLHKCGDAARLIVVAFAVRPPMSQLG